MCTVIEAEGRAMVCDRALPGVRAALEGHPALAIRFASHPTDGTEIRVTSGDVERFGAVVRTAVAKANE
jgi:hypothetical protein